MTNIIKNLNILIHSFFKQITYLGSFVISFIIVVLLYFFNKRFAFLLFLGLISVNVISYIIKIVYFKDRPRKQSSNTPLERIDAASFPSVHSGRVTTILFWLYFFSNNITLIILCSFLWAFVIYSRFYLKKHYWSDIFGGILIAIIINTILLKVFL
ncbi:MAG: hypothetical protein KatS3mg002_0201 [Candidatus Woesearchaeota archaeon]|nr:MAG: hypothetical protein KatS3mg002_0201 [Candidatus Woesearchaeota archaeon]